MMMDVADIKLVTEKIVEPVVLAVHERAQKGLALVRGRQDKSSFRMSQLERDVRKAETRARENSRYLGVHVPGEHYAPGDMCTHGGSGWHCLAPTTDAPGQSEAWRLALKKGSDGKPGPQGEVGPMPRHEWKGTSLRFQQPLPNGGTTWGEYMNLEGPRGMPGSSAGGSSTVVVQNQSFSFYPNGWA